MWKQRCKTIIATPTTIPFTQLMRFSVEDKANCRLNLPFHLKHYLAILLTSYGQNTILSIASLDVINYTLINILAFQ
jgi:hypothetical protein